MRVKLSEIFLKNYWEVLEDGIGPQLTHSRKMFLRGRQIQWQVVLCSTFYNIKFISSGSCSQRTVSPGPAA